MARRLLVLVLIAWGAPAATVTATPAVAADGPALQAGVSRVDITPPTGYVLGGWVREDSRGLGVHTRLWATVLVLRRGDTKVALVAQSLFASTGGLVAEAAEMAGRGFSERNVLVSASHTHGGPGGYANFSTLNTSAPSLQTATDPASYFAFLDPGPPDPALYRFLVERLALALVRADQDRRPAVAGWGRTALRGVTANRSVEAHLANHGVVRERGDGAADQDPDGAAHTVDATVDVLRVDRLVRRGRRTVRRPLGGWFLFPNHGTVNEPRFQVYNADHHGPAVLATESAIRRAGRVPPSQPVVAVYGNGNEGDMSAGLERRGPTHAERVGRAEARAFLRGWRDAGRRLRRRPPLDLRWTRVCFCGQTTEAGRVADTPVPGLPFLTGSEENRGPLFDITGVPFEGIRAPVEGFESQGHKVGVPVTSEASYPKAVPLFVVRIGDGLLASLPGEPTIEVGRRARAAVRAAAPRGVRRVVLAGLTNEFIQYLTTPEEYDRQHYEGGSTIYGPASAPLLTARLGDLTARMAAGRPAPEAFAFDPRNGVLPNGPAFGRGADAGTVLDEPVGTVGPRGQVALRWQGGPRGEDRPLDRAFVTVERRRGARWRTVADDLGLQLLWTVDDDGRYTAFWEVPDGARAGDHRLRVTANRYALVSRPFAVRPGGPATVLREPFTLRR